MKKKLIFVISSLTSGGAEKVMSQIANLLVSKAEITLIVLSKKEKFYLIDERVKLIEPDFVIKEMPRIIFALKSFFWLRKQLSIIDSKYVLSFNGKFNSFVLLSSLGLNKSVYISDRSRPGISYGNLLDKLNPIIYRFSKGIIAQTEVAKKNIQKQTRHKNIKVIPNPIQLKNKTYNGEREKVILNVGRFINSKHQDWLINYFNTINNSDWKLIFLGEGENFDRVKTLAANSLMSNNILFQGNVKEIDRWYTKSSIFAFTSTSEGFPNALAEAMSNGCACIAFDCIAGPSDIIDNDINGFLIQDSNHDEFITKLNKLMSDESLRNNFGMAAINKMKKFDAEEVAMNYLDFITTDENCN